MCSDSNVFKIPLNAVFLFMIENMRVLYFGTCLEFAFGYKLNNANFVIAQI